ncbi:hypothetical protein CDAR_295441 [Caerostris darwini]|uniref:Uncharacterized protein n=1 Tax=Caerostris darwini TaxID=1538125 RepID=A0AAV4QSE3_9ARAC|nr:hypothetical protein CDAR_295441 [Caerostris darwini]
MTGRSIHGSHPGKSTRSPSTVSCIKYFKKKSLLSIKWKMVQKEVVVESLQFYLSSRSDLNLNPIFLCADCRRNKFESEISTEYFFRQIMCPFAVNVEI